MQVRSNGVADKISSVSPTTDEARINSSTYYTESGIARAGPGAPHTPGIARAGPGAPHTPGIARAGLGAPHIIPGIARAEQVLHILRAYIVRAEPGATHSRHSWS